MDQRTKLGRDAGRIAAKMASDMGSDRQANMCAMVILVADIFVGTLDPKDRLSEFEQFTAVVQRILKKSMT